MIRSMTGFGRCEQTDGDRKIVIEMKAVNHRYCDMNFKMPKKLAPFEIKMRNVIKEYASRGKVDVYVTYETEAEGDSYVCYNEEIAREYVENIRKMAETFSLPQDIKASQLARFPEVFTIEERSVDEEALWAFVEPVLCGCCESFLKAREEEGKRLYEDLIQKLSNMQKVVDAIEKRSPEVFMEYREKLENKVQELLENATIDEMRIAAEVTIFADKICVDEEIVRLRSHIAGAKAVLEEGMCKGNSDGVGRKLDFLAQEMNREANTILSKANDVAVSNYGIELKTEIEKVREQIQNIE